MMRKVLLMLVFAVAVGFTACKESTVDVEDDSKNTLQEKTNLISNGYWIVASLTEGGSGDEMSCKFDSDGTLTSNYFGDRETEYASWSFTPTGDTLAIKSGNELSRFKVVTLNDKTLKLKGLTGEEVAQLELYRVDKEYKFAMVGKIDNTLGTSLNNNMKVIAAWFGSNDDGDYMYVYGKGSIDVATNTFFIGFEYDLPDLAVFKDKTSDFKMGIGYIFLVKNDIPVGMYSTHLDNRDIMESQVIGAVENKGIFMQYSTTAVQPDGAWDWLKAFGFGWSFGEGVENNTGSFDTWKPVAPFDLILRTDASDNLKFPNWK